MLLLRVVFYNTLLVQALAINTISLEVCHKTHRAHPTSRTMFQMLDGKFWIDVDCGHLVWNQVLCRCVYRKGVDRAACSDFVTGDKAGFYKKWNGLIWEEHTCNQFENQGFLVWNQEKCRCDWDSNQDQQLSNVLPVTEDLSECETLLKISFDDGFNDESHESVLERYEPSRSYLVRDSGGQVACFKDSPILVPYFSQNSLQDTFHISFRFKICHNRSMDARLQTIFHNSCYIEGEGLISATIALGFQAAHRMFMIDMDTEETIIPLTDSCTADIDPTEWNEMEVRYQDRVLSLDVNNKSCLNSNYFRGPVKRFKCPLVIPGEDFCGCLDDVSITRGCRV